MADGNKANYGRVSGLVSSFFPCLSRPRTSVAPDHVWPKATAFPASRLNQYSPRYDVYPYQPTGALCNPHNAEKIKLR